VPWSNTTGGQGCKLPGGKKSPTEGGYSRCQKKGDKEKENPPGWKSISRARRKISYMKGARGLLSKIKRVKITHLRKESEKPGFRRNTGQIRGANAG